MRGTTLEPGPALADQAGNEGTTLEPGPALADQAGDEGTILGQVGIEGSYLLAATAANAVAMAPPGERYTTFNRHPARPAETRAFPTGRNCLPSHRSTPACTAP